jgi:Xaa-Pro aminopeptidase
VPSRNEAKIIFDGEGLNNKSKPSHIQEVKPLENLNYELSIAGLEVLHLNFGKTRPNGSMCFQVEDKYFSNLFSTSIVKSELYDAICGLRSIKTEHELELMRTSGQIASEGHKFCMRHTHEGINEGQIAQLFKFYSGMNSCPNMAYPPICGSGANAAILHYHDNNKTLKNGDLLLCDMGV